MNCLKRILIAVVIMMLSVSNLVCANSASLHYAKGDKIQDFSFTTYDGQVITLSEVLKDKDAVLINIWATWCGPCRNEFPYLEEAYKQYQDKVEVIALSCEPSDNSATLAAFAYQYGLTFKIGQDPVGFLSALGIGSIPTSIVIDRFGTICFIESGSQPDVASFTRLFDVFIGDDYTESILLDGIPAARPLFSADSNDELSDALEADASNPHSTYAWPMIVTEKDGRRVVASTNAGYDSTVSAVSVNVNACEDDAIVVTFKTSTENAMDLLSITVNGKVDKFFGGEHDWMTYAIPVGADGTYSVELSYTKDKMYQSGEDTIWIDSVKVVSGAAASTALAANPVYTVSAENSLTVTNPTAKEISISDESGILYANFGDARYYIINDDVASFQAMLNSDCDPECAFVYCNYDGSITPVLANNYIAYGGVDSLETTGYTFTCMFLYPDASGAGMKSVVYFKDEANVNQFVNVNHLGNWSYLNHSPASDNLRPATSITSYSDYIIYCVDQYGRPVEGAVIQVCDEETCQVLITDANGKCEYTAAPYAWEVHVLIAPAGYTADSSDIVFAPVNGGNMTFTFTAY